MLVVMATVGRVAPAYAHGFGARYDLPIPLWLYATGAAAAVALSFVVIGLFVRGTPRPRGYPRVNLLRWRGGRLLACPVVLLVGRLLSVGLFAVVVIAGLFGDQRPVKNPVPTLIWVLWWVGLAYVSALVGNLWAVLNPWRTTFAWMEALYRRWCPQRELSRHLPYPQWLGVWPGVGLFLAFVWVENVFSGRAVPAYLALMAIGYSLLTWLGMFLFGRETWLQHGEAFAIVFGLLARFAPTEVRVTQPAVCAACHLGCQNQHGDCVNCYACFERAEHTAREWNLRPFAVGLLHGQGVSPSMMAFVILLLATVTFDGFTETPAWWGLTKILYFRIIPEVGIDHLTLTDTVSLLGFMTLCFGIYLGFCRFMAAAAGDVLPTGVLARAFALSLVPIALAYHLAHYFSFLLIQGQFIIPLASDPLGMGWNLLGTAGYEMNVTIIGSRFVWFLAVGAIVIGHIIAVYLAHVIALRIFQARRPALYSQYPMLALMVSYTMVSLWILAQPIVKSPPVS
jgi:hypothetical protein